jgi:hypothetical protein
MQESLEIEGGGPTAFEITLGIKGTFDLLVSERKAPIPLRTRTTSTNGNIYRIVQFILPADWHCQLYSSDLPILSAVCPYYRRQNHS